MGKQVIGNVFPPDEYLLARCAPAGYGVGTDTQQLITYDQIGEAYASGLYWVDCTGKAIGGVPLGFALLRVSGYGATHCVQELFPAGLDIVLIRRCQDGMWPEQWHKNEWTYTTYVEGL